jgi:CheY-like chemotaxis protein
MSNSLILLIEDNKSISDALSWALEYEGYKVITATNGKEALSILQDDPLPNLIFLDLMMPILDGFEFRKRQQEDPRLSQIPTVIISAKNADAITPSSGELFLAKPFDLNKFYMILRKYCN